tara:strand:+ start:947 stop:1126 length:180 start_codon:yes stop_codon:yes gene_type:complete
MSVYYLITVTRGDFTTKVYWKEPTYKRLMQSVDVLYHVAKMDAVELEQISKQEYEDNYI